MVRDISRLSMLNITDNFERDHFKRMVVHYFPNNEGIFNLSNIEMDSDIDGHKKAEENQNANVENADGAGMIVKSKERIILLARVLMVLAMAMQN